VLLLTKRMPPKPTWTWRRRRRGPCKDLLEVVLGVLQRSTI
jgi:hypothetical protein